MSKSELKSTTTRKKLPLPTENVSLQKEISDESTFKPCTPKLQRVLSLDFLQDNVEEDFLAREHQIHQIKEYIGKCIQNEPPKHKILLISGYPGIGKTMCIREILSKSKSEVLEFNANIMKNFKEIEDTLKAKFLKQPQKSRDLSDSFEEYFQNPANKPVIVYVQQIEVMFKQISKETVERILQLFSVLKQKLMLIGITNQINFAGRLEEKINRRIKGLKQIIFQPYDSAKMFLIMKKKLEKVRSQTDLQLQFSEKLIKFVVSNLELYKKGDIRILIQFLKTLLCPILLQSIREEKNRFEIDIKMVNQVLSKTKGEKAKFIMSLPYQQQILLTILYNYIKQTESLEVSQKVLIGQIKKMCQILQLTYRKEMLEGLKELENYNFIRIKKGRGDSKIILGLSMQQISLAIGSHTILSKFYE